MIQAIHTKPLPNPQVEEVHMEHPEAPPPPTHQSHTDTGDLLIVSPYTSPPHLLDLRTLNTAQQLLAKALTILEATRLDYATAPYVEAFNWDAVFAKLQELTRYQNYQWKRQHFYILIFRSRIPPTTSRLKLNLLDQTSHAEATASGGLLKYWFGTPSAEGRNLATCIWRHPTDPRPATSGPSHRAAARATINLYTEWNIERLKLEIGDGVDEWDFSIWDDLI